MNHHAQGGPGSAGDLPDVRPGVEPGPAGGGEGAAAADATGDAARDAAEAARGELRRRRDELSGGTSEAAGPVTVSGVVRWLDVEGGVWVLDRLDPLDPLDGADSGERLQLIGVVDPGWAEREVVLTGVLRPDLMTTAQVGPVLEVGAGEVTGG